MLFINNSKETRGFVGKKECKIGWRNLWVWGIILIGGQYIGPGNIDSYEEAKIYLLAARSNKIHSLPALSSSCRKQIEKQYTKILTKVVFIYKSLQWPDHLVCVVQHGDTMLRFTRGRRKGVWKDPDARGWVPSKDPNRMLLGPKHPVCQLSGHTSQGAHSTGGHPRDMLGQLPWLACAFLSRQRQQAVWGRLCSCHEKKQSPEGVRL